MGSSSNSTWESLERWSPKLFLIAGGLLVLAAIAAGVNAVNGVARSPVGSVVGPVGLAISFVGLLGLYPRVADRTPWLARAGAVFAVVGIVGYAGISVGNFVSLLGGNPEGPPGWATVFVPALVLGTLIGFLSFGAASLRTNVLSRTIGLLLVVPPAIFIVMLVGEIVGYTPVWDNFVLTTGQALALLGLGYTLRTEGTLTGRSEPTPDSAA